MISKSMMKRQTVQRGESLDSISSVSGNVTNIDDSRKQLLSLATEHGATKQTSYYISLEGVEVPYQILSMTEKQLEAIIEAHLLENQTQTNGVLAVALEALAWSAGHLANEQVIERAIEAVKKALINNNEPTKGDENDEKTEK